MPEFDGKPLTKDQRPALYSHFLKSALSILKGEQERVGAGGKEESEALINQLAAYAYNQEPFRSHPWDIGMKPLDFWKGLESDPRSRQLSVRT